MEMMGRGLVLILAICGCYNPHPQAGAPCSRGEPCPAGQACVDGRCGGTVEVPPDAVTMFSDGPLPPDASGPNDPDGDGILTANDNCPDKANANQANEDGDPLGDACDPCPIDPANPPSDPDGDGVSDSCDPHPTAAVDSIVLFEGFKSGVPPTWQVIGSTMQSGDDIVAVGVANNHVALIPPITAPTNGVITVKGAINATFGTTDAWLSVGMPYNPVQDSGIFCELWHPFQGSSTGRDIDIFDTPANAVRAFKAFNWQNNTPYVLAERRNNTNYVCTSTGGSTEQVMSSTSSNPGDNKVVIHIGQATATISWVLVVSSSQ